MYDDWSANLDLSYSKVERNDIILETNAPGPNPFSTDKGEGFRHVLEAQLKHSAQALRQMGA